jgi:DNA-binding Xre family transcriptional regulator
MAPTTVNRMANNLTKQVSLRTLDSLAKALSAPGRRVKPADLIREVPEKRGKR